MIAVKLQLEGFNVVGVAADGRKAVGLVGRELPDLVTMDIMMPVMDGIEATKIITKEHPSTRVIMVTARTDRETLYRCLTAGAVGFLTKPFSMDELTATMREAARGGLPIAAGIMASMPENAAGNVLGPPVAFFTEVESVILRHLAENASSRTIAAATGLTLPEVAEIQSLIAQKIELRNAIESHSGPHSQ
jgi:DNA-binding NarL/FixJ family response regulator